MFGVIASQPAVIAALLLCQQPAFPASNAVAKGQGGSPLTGKVTPGRLPRRNLPLGAVRRLGWGCFRHEGEVASLSFSADGKLLVSGGGHPDLLALWNVPKGDKLLSREAGRLGCGTWLRRE
jgi:hypothetical protein